MALTSLAYLLLPPPHHHHPQDSHPSHLVCLSRLQRYAYASCEDPLKTQQGTCPQI